MRPRAWFVLFGFLVLIAGVRTVHVSVVEIVPAGTSLNVRTTQPIDADSARVGMGIDAIVDDPVAVNRTIVIPRGAIATLEIVRAERSSNMSGRDRITFRVLSLNVGGVSYPVETSLIEFKGPSEGKKAARKIAGGAGIGAALGGIFGGGSGAALGAITGGATGAIMTGSGKTHLVVPAETRLRFRLHGGIRIQG